MLKIQNFVLCLFAVIAISFPLSAGASSEKAQIMSLTESEALNTTHLWASLVSESDTNALDKLLLNNYMHIHATALVESKDKFVEALKTGARKYDPIKIEETNVRNFGNTAVVTGKFALKATTRDKVIESINRFSLLIIQSKSGIQVASFQATLIPPPKL